MEGSAVMPEVVNVAPGNSTILDSHHCHTSQYLDRMLGLSSVEQSCHSCIQYHTLFLQETSPVAMQLGSDVAVQRIHTYITYLGYRDAG